MPHPSLAPRLLLGVLLTITAVPMPPPAAAADEPCERAQAIVGTAGRDVLTGTMGDDVICGLGGRDVIDGLGGDDLLVGGDGADVISGRSGEDTIEGGAGDDTLDGGGAADVLAGGSGDDLLRGGAEGDELRGGSGHDRASYDPEDTWRGMEVNLTPATGNLVLGIGDSNMASGQQGYYPDVVPMGTPMTIWPGYVDPLSVLARGVAVAQGRALYGGGFGAAGAITGQIFQTQLDRALAQRPRAVVIVAGTNNVTAGGPYVAQAKADYRAATSKLRYAGVTPVLTTLLPRNDGLAAETLSFNAWLRDLAASRAYPIADLHAALAAPDGRFLPGTNRDDLHLTPTGARIAGTVLGETLMRSLPPVPAALAEPRGHGDDLVTVFDDPLFLADADADGRPDRVAGGAALEVGTVEDARHAAGRLLRVVRRDADGAVNISVPVLAGQRLYVSGRLRTTLEAMGGEFAIRAQGLPGYVPLWELRVASDLPAGAVLPPVSFTVPAGVGQVKFALSLKRGGSFELGQFTVAGATAG